MQTDEYFLLPSHRFPPDAIRCAQCGMTTAELANRPRLGCIETREQHEARTQWETAGEDVTERSGVRT